MAALLKTHFCFRRIGSPASFVMVAIINWTDQWTSPATDSTECDDYSCLVIYVCTFSKYHFDIYYVYV